jgi:hypothetical protein
MSSEVLFTLTIQVYTLYVYRVCTLLGPPPCEDQTWAVDMLNWHYVFGDRYRGH